MARKTREKQEVDMVGDLEFIHVGELLLSPKLKVSPSRPPLLSPASEPLREHQMISRLYVVNSQQPSRSCPNFYVIRVDRILRSNANIALEEIMHRHSSALAVDHAMKVLIIHIDYQDLQSATKVTIGSNLSIAS